MQFVNKNKYYTNWYLKEKFQLKKEKIKNIRTALYLLTSTAMSSQKKKSPIELPKLIHESVQHTKTNKTRKPKEPTRIWLSFIYRLVR